MRTESFPPLCPFGDSEADGLTIDLVEATVSLFPLTPGDTVFLRINTYADDRTVTYFIGDLRAIQDDLLDRLEAWDLHLKPDDLALLRKWKLARLAKHLK